MKNLYVLSLHPNDGSVWEIAQPLVSIALWLEENEDSGFVDMMNREIQKEFPFVFFILDKIDQYLPSSTNAGEVMNYFKSKIE